MSLKIGEILVKQGLLRRDQLNKAIEEQKNLRNSCLTGTIVSMGLLKENQILRAVEKFYQIPGVDLGSFELDKSVLSLVKKEICEKNTLIPIQKAGGTLVVAFGDPANIMVREDLRHLTRMKIQPVVATISAITMAIDKYYVESLNSAAMKVPVAGSSAADEYDELAQGDNRSY